VEHRGQRFEGDKYMTSKTESTRIIRAQVKTYRDAITRQVLDAKKGGIVGDSFYREKWGFDKLSAEIEWVGLQRQLQVMGEYWIRRIDTVGLDEARVEFSKQWGAKHRNRRDKNIQKDMDDVFYRFNEATDGVMNQ